MKKCKLQLIKAIIISDQQYYYDKIVRISKTINNTPKSKKLKRLIYRIMQNKLAPKRNIWILGKIGNDTKIYHQNVIINSHAVVGDNVVFHGNNMIGNDGDNLNKAPRIGDNVEFGYGASVIGDISVANGVVIGAHALVTHSINTENAIVVGIPARIIGVKERQ